MARYIDADAEIAYIKRTYCAECNHHDGIKCKSCGIDDALMLLEEADDADVVEVVRCKDCQYCKESEVTDRLFCDWHREYFETEADNFCSYGERKEK